MALTAVLHRKGLVNVHGQHCRACYKRRRIHSLKQGHDLSPTPSPVQPFELSQGVKCAIQIEWSMITLQEVLHHSRWCQHASQDQLGAPQDAFAPSASSCCWMEEPNGPLHAVVHAQTGRHVREGASKIGQCVHVANLTDLILTCCGSSIGWSSAQFEVCEACTIVHKAKAGAAEGYCNDNSLSPCAADVRV